MSDNIELKPCPFCGHRAEFQYCDDSWERYWIVTCSNSRCKVHPQTVCFGREERMKAAAAWNRRAEALAAPAGNMAEMRNALVSLRALIDDEPDGTPMMDAMKATIDAALADVSAHLA